MGLETDPETAAHRAKNKLTFNPLLWKEEYIYGITGTFASGQASCANMAILKFCQYLGNRCL